MNAYIPPSRDQLSKMNDTELLNKLIEIVEENAEYGYHYDAIDDAKNEILKRLANK